MGRNMASLGSQRNGIGSEGYWHFGKDCKMMRMIKLSCISSMANKRGTIVQFYMPIAESEAGQQSVTVHSFFSVPVLFLVSLFPVPVPNSLEFSGTSTKFYWYRYVLFSGAKFFRYRYHSKRSKIPWTRMSLSADRVVFSCEKPSPQFHIVAPIVTWWSRVVPHMYNMYIWFQVVHYCTVTHDLQL